MPTAKLDERGRLLLPKEVRKGSLAINAIIFSEVFHKLYKLTGLKQAKERTSKILKSDFVVYLPIEKNTIEKSIDLSFSHNLRINDSIIAQHVIDSKSDGIL